MKPINDRMYECHQKIRRRLSSFITSADVIVNVNNNIWIPMNASIRIINNKHDETI